MGQHQVADDIGGETDDGTDRQIDVARQHDQRLTDRDQCHDRDAGGDAGEQSRLVIVVDLRAEEGEDQHDDGNQRTYAQDLRADAVEDLQHHAALLRLAGGEAHHRFLRGAVAVENAHLPALAHHHDAVGQRQHFRQVGRDRDDRHALARQLMDDRMHLCLGADVDAARRLVEDENARRHVQPLRQHHLLLVAAG